MLHRFLLCIALLSLVASAQPGQRSTDGNAESWTFGYGSDEAGGGTSYMGVDIADVRAERLSELKLKEEHGAEITMVDEDAPAGKAGLREHDVILSLNGTTIESAAQLRRMIKEIPPGRVVTLGISREGQPLTIKVQLADRDKAKHWQPGAHDFNFKMPELPSIPDIDLPITVVIAHSSLRSGLMVENITPQLGEFFGVKDGKGALVRSVEKGSRGEKAGFRAGDVIVKVNNQPVHDASDFTSALRQSSGGNAAVTVMRDRHEQNLTLSLPEKKDSGQIFENSFEIPELTAETQLAIRGAESEMARLGPEMENLQRDLKIAAEARKKAEENFCQGQKDFKKRMEDQQKKMKERQQMMLDRQQKVRHELTRKWAEI
ncbi:MAG: PDZ domain-containing protein [Terriglobales bacterium]